MAVIPEPLYSGTVFPYSASMAQGQLSNVSRMLKNTLIRPEYGGFQPIEVTPSSSLSSQSSSKLQTQSHQVSSKSPPQSALLSKSSPKLAKLGVESLNFADAVKTWLLPSGLSSSLSDSTESLSTSIQSSKHHVAKSNLQQSGSSTSTPQSALYTHIMNFTQGAYAAAYFDQFLLTYPSFSSSSQTSLYPSSIVADFTSVTNQSTVFGPPIVHALLMNAIYQFSVRKFRMPSLYFFCFPS